MTFKEPIPKKWAHAYLNCDFLEVRTRSGFRAGYPDPSGSQVRLPAEAADLEVGVALLDALSKSRFLHPHDHPECFDIRGRVVPYYDSWVKDVMTQFKYRSKREMFKDMKSCSVELVDGEITIFPSHHEKLEAWSGDGLTESDRVVVTASERPEAVGAALRLAFDRCTY